MARVVVIVLCWNSAGRIEACLESLRRQAPGDFELVVVDNASADGSPAIVRERWPGAAILRQTTNTGFTGGVNRGLRHMLKGHAEFAWLLNDDTEFGPGVLAALLARADAADRPGLVSPFLQDSNGRLPFGPAGAYPRHPRASRPAGDVTPQNAMFIPGTALLIRRAVFEHIGLLDARFFLYREDNDFCLRAQRAGFAGVYCPDAVVHHAFGRAATTRGPAALYFRIRNMLLFQRTHSPRRRWPRYYLGTLATGIHQARRRMDRGEPLAAAATLAGAWDGLRGSTGGPYDPSRGMPEAIRRILMMRTGFLGGGPPGRAPKAGRRATRRRSPR